MQLTIRTFKKLSLAIVSLFFLSSLSAQKVGVETNSPDSTFSVKNKVEIGGGQGDILFTDDKGSITFPVATPGNSAMINMFQSGFTNADRMVIAHSPAYQTYGLQYSDSNEQFHFLGNGNKAFSIDVDNANAALGNTASISSLFTLHVATNQNDRTGYFYNNKNTSATTYGIYGGAFGTGTGAKRGGSFDAFGGTTGDNIGMRATAGGGSTAYAVWASATGAGDYAGYFNGRGYFSSETGLGIAPSSSRMLNVLADGSQSTGVYVKNEYAGTAAKYGYYNFLDAQGTGTRYGFYSTMAANSTDNSPSYGIRSYVNSNSSPGTIYGVYSSISSTGTGNKYGVYSAVSNATNRWAGYFSGRVQIINGGEASLTSHGYLQLGSTTGVNMVYDNNEITARNNGATSPLYLQPNQGVVSIGGDVAAGYLLSVDGKIMSEELKVQSSGAWPDYVFAEDYDLKTIEEYEASIKENSHLPGIPSAKVIEEEGIMVGDMQKRQMEKIEELALYVIQLNKRMNQLEKENEVLKNEVKELKK